MSVRALVIAWLKWLSFVLVVSQVAPLAADQRKNSLSYGCTDQKLYLCQAGAGDVALVFVHGWGGRAQHWKHQLAYFAEKYAVYAMDLPGHGGSELAEIKPTISGIADGLQNLLTRIETNNVILIAHDIGGYIALSLATSEIGKQKIKAIIAVESMIDTKVTMPKKQYRRVLKSLQKNFKKTAYQMTIDLFSPDFDSETMSWVAESVANTDASLSLALLNDFMNMDMSHELSVYQGELVVVNTEYNPPRLDELKGLNPKVWVESVGWSEHFIFLEDPELFNARLEQLITRLLDPAGFSRSSQHALGRD